MHIYNCWSTINYAVWPAVPLPCYMGLLGGHLVYFFFVLLPTQLPALFLLHWFELSQWLNIWGMHMLTHTGRSIQIFTYSSVHISSPSGVPKLWEFWFLSFVACLIWETFLVLLPSPDLYFFPNLSKTQCPSVSLCGHTLFSLAFHTPALCCTTSSCQELRCNRCSLSLSLLQNVHFFFIS